MNSGTTKSLQPPPNRKFAPWLSVILPPAAVAWPAAMCDTIAKSII